MPSSKTLVYCTGDEDRRSSLDYHEGKIPQTTEIHKTIAYSNHEAVIASLRREPSTNPLEAENQYYGWFLLPRPFQADVF